MPLEHIRHMYRAIEQPVHFAKAICYGSKNDCIQIWLIKIQFEDMCCTCTYNELNFCVAVNSL